MKKRITLLSILLISAFFHAQTHRFFYEVQFLSETNDNDFTKDIVILDVNPDNIKSYSINYLRTDSTKNKTPDQYNILPPKFKKRITRKLGSDVFTNYESIYNNYYSFETIDQINWKILPEKKTYEDFQLQKATADFGGRTWTAWFTTEIPFQYGPYKFGGLPGLIILINDSENQFQFKFIKNENLKETANTDFFIEKNYGMEKAVPVSEKKFHQLKIDYFLDPYSSMKSGREKATFYDENRMPITPDFKKMTAEMQEYLKQINLIERSKAPIYPAIKK